MICGSYEGKVLRNHVSPLSHAGKQALSRTSATATPALASAGSSSLDSTIRLALCARGPTSWLDGESVDPAVKADCNAHTRGRIICKSAAESRACVARTAVLQSHEHDSRSHFAAPLGSYLGTLGSARTNDVHCRKRRAWAARGCVHRGLAAALVKADRVQVLEFALFFAL